MTNHKQTEPLLAPTQIMRISLGYVIAICAAAFAIGGSVTALVAKMSSIEAKVDKLTAIVTQHIGVQIADTSMPAKETP